MAVYFVLDLMALPFLGEWMAKKGRVVFIGYAAGYVAAATQYVSSLTGVHTVVRWEESPVSVERLSRGIVFPKVRINERVVFVQRRSVELLAAAAGDTPSASR